jgi:uncharacterized protein YraI
MPLIFKSLSLVVLLLLTACLPERTNPTTPAITPQSIPENNPGHVGPPSLSAIVPVSVREGPGMDFPIMFEYSAGTTAPIMGRTSLGDWLAVPGPGDGAGPIGWVPITAVTIQGDLSTVAVVPNQMPAPQTGSPSSLPLILDPGSPPTNACTAAVPSGSQPVILYLGPGDQFAPIARLGNWAQVLSTSGGWVQVQIGPGETGWAPVFHVLLRGPCTNSGAVCMASPKLADAPPNLHLGPGEHFGLAGVLETPAQVLGSEMNWLQVQVGPGEIGWVKPEMITVSGDCTGFPTAPRP